jgi:hypothetical protein
MCFIPPDFERASLRGDRGNKEVEDSIPALTFFEPRSSVIASNDYGERYWDNFTKASVIASNDWLIVGLLDEVRQFLIPLKEFADLVDANFKKLTFKLVGTSWKTYCYLFKLRLLSCLDTKSVQKTKSLNLKNDKKADSTHHFHGLRLPPPQGQNQTSHLTENAPQIHVGIRGVNHDMPHADNQTTNKVEENQWKISIRESENGSKLGKKQIH